MTHREACGNLGQAAREHARDQLIDPRRSSRTPGRINLRAVSEVLAARGLDPTEEILKILSPEDGQSKLDADVRARLWTEILQYTQPKLKSVEVKAKVAATAFDVSNDQARRIAEEFLRSGAGQVAMGLDSDDGED